MGDKIREGFLRRQFEQAVALADESDILELVPVSGDPPERYIVGFSANGLVQEPGGEIVEFARCDVGIWMPNDYLRRVDMRHVLTYLGPHPRPWHPNVRPPYICVHILPAMPLIDLIYTCFEVWTWNLFGTGDEGLNHAAAQWARNQEPGRFPVDRRPLKRRALDLEIETVEQGTPE
jgi:hypothetical protein